MKYEVKVSGYITIDLPDNLTADEIHNQARPAAGEVLNEDNSEFMDTLEIVSITKDA